MQIEKYELTEKEAKVAECGEICFDDFHDPELGYQHFDGDPAYITHQRSDNSRWKWEYDAGINTGTDADTTGFLGSRESLTSGQ